MKKILSAFIILVALTANSTVALATHEEEHCVQVYGGGVVCGAKEHEPVDTDLGDINPAVLGGVLLATSGALFYFSKKLRLSTSQAN